MPRAFERFSHQSLVLGAGAGAVVGQDFRVRGHKAAQNLRVFIVHGADFIAAKIALLFGNRLVIPLRFYIGHGVDK